MQKHGNVKKDVKEKRGEKMEREIVKTKIPNQVKRRKTKLIVAKALVLMMTCGLLAGCGGNSGKITIAGSTSVQPLSEALAKSYHESNPKVTIDVQGGGSGEAVKSIKNNLAQIGSLSRELTSDEAKSVSKQYTIAKDGVAVVVNKNVGISNITLAQLKNIYTGKTTNWSQLGGSSAKIAVVSREEGSGTREAFTDKTGVLVAKSNGDKTDNTTKKAVVQPSTGAVMKTVASTPNSIGYVSLASVSKSVKVLQVENVTPSEKTVLDGTYKIQRPFIYAVGSKVDKTTTTFIKWVLSDEGQSQIKSDGFIPINKAKQ